MRYFQNILETIGQTPMVKINKLNPNKNVNLLAKIEFFNPGGSVKDRMAFYMLEAAEERGVLKPGRTIVEATSGNTGVGVAIVAAVKGYKVILVVTKKVSREKVKLLKAFGVKVIVTPYGVSKEDPQSRFSVAERKARQIGGFYLNQHQNLDNPKAHYLTTGPEIWRQTKGKINYLVAGLGTGGTITGVGKFLKEKNPKIKIIGIDPFGSNYYWHFKKKKGKVGPYKTEGIGDDGFIPKAWDESLVDEMYQVKDRDAFEMARKLTRREGIFVGGSSGAAMWAAVEIAKKGKKGETIVAILPDGGMRYLSKIYDDKWMKKNL